MELDSSIKTFWSTSLYSRVVAENRKSKASYLKNYLATYSGNMKMLWSGNKSIINAKKKSANLISSLTDKDENSVNDSSKMEEIFNDFFTNISAKLNDSIPHTEVTPGLFNK